MITEKDCIALAKKHQNKDCSYSSMLYKHYVVQSPDRRYFLDYDNIYGWVVVELFVDREFLFQNFEDVKDQIIDFFLKFDPTLEQQFLNRKHKKILQQPKILEAL